MPPPSTPQGIVVRHSARLLRIAFRTWDHATLAARPPDVRTLSAEDFCRVYDPA